MQHAQIDRPLDESRSIPAARRSTAGMWPGLGRGVLPCAAMVVVGVLVWQGVTAHGSPDPTKANTGHLAAVFDIGVLVFREGLECILVLAAIMGGMSGERHVYRRPIAWGVALGFFFTMVTWFVAVGIVSSLSDNVSALHLQAATGLVAVVVLVVIMNWFFHRVYWGGWIGLHNRRKKALLQGAEESESRPRLWWGLALLGFSSLYREGFEVVLFLQTYRLRLGDGTVLTGAAVGLVLSGIVAVLTFVAHRKLPYRKMLVLTGILLGGVLLVMVGEQAQEMQLAHWLPTTNVGWLAALAPDWSGVWFGFYPTVQTIAAQALAAVLVIGSYYAARKHSSKRPVTAGASAA